MRFELGALCVCCVCLLASVVPFGLGGVSLPEVGGQIGLAAAGAGAEGGNKGKEKNQFAQRLDVHERPPLASRPASRRQRIRHRLLIPTDEFT